MRRTLRSSRLSALRWAATTLAITFIVAGVIAVGGAGALDELLPSATTDVAAATSSRIGLYRGIYFGWTDGQETAFNLAGSACPNEDSLQEFSLSGGVLRRPLSFTGSEATTYGAPLDHDREVQVTSISPSALLGLSRQDSAAGAKAGAGAGNETEEVSFTGVRALCRSWREVDADIGRAGVLLLPGPSPNGSSAVGAPESAVEVHVVPVPERIDVLAMLLLSNRTQERLVVSALKYAPEAVATNRVVAVAGFFEQYSTMQDRLFGRRADEHSPAARPAARSTTAVPSLHDARDLDLRLAPGGIALIAIERGSFVAPRSSFITPGTSFFAPRATDEALSYLAYPVIYYRRAGAGSSLTTEPTGPALTQRMALTTPLYARWSP